MIIALQCCISFCCIAIWISHMYTYIPSTLRPLPTPLQSHLSRSSQRTKLSSLCYIAASHQISVLYMVVYICQCYSLSSFHLPLPPLNSIYLYYLIISELLSPTLGYKFCGEKDHAYFLLTIGYLLLRSLFSKYGLNAEWTDTVGNAIPVL